MKVNVNTIITDSLAYAFSSDYSMTNALDNTNLLTSGVVDEHNNCATTSCNIAEDYYKYIMAIWEESKNKLKEDIKMNIVNMEELVQSTTFNEKKGVTTVVLKDGRIGMSRCSENDEYDKYVGFALAFANALMGSKNAYHKFVQKFEKNNL